MSKTRECKCFDQINEHLKPYHGELLCNLFGPPRAIVSTFQNRVNGRKPKMRMPLVFATFCPFCGTKYPKSDRYTRGLTTASAGSRPRAPAVRPQGATPSSPAFPTRGER